jgi:hypothetical protein
MKVDEVSTWQEAFAVQVRRLEREAADRRGFLERFEKLLEATRWAARLFSEYVAEGTDERRALQSIARSLYEEYDIRRLPEVACFMNELLEGDPRALFYRLG